MKMFKKLLAAVCVLIVFLMFMSCSKIAPAFHFLIMDPGGNDNYERDGSYYGIYYPYRTTVDTIELVGSAELTECNSCGIYGVSINKITDWQQVNGPIADIKPVGEPTFLQGSRAIVTWPTPLTEEAVFAFSAITSTGEGRTAYAIVKPNPGNLTVDAGPNQTISPTASAVNLSGTATTTGTIISSEWTQVRTPYTGIAVIANFTALSTTVTGLTTEGDWYFRLTVTDNFGVKISKEVRVNVSSSYLSSFFIDPDIYKVQKITRPLTNRITAESYRSGIDSSSITFIFSAAASIPPSGATKEYKVVGSDIPASDEVKVVLVHQEGSNGKLYICQGTDNVKATVTVSVNGKVSIVMPITDAKLVLATEIKKVSADIQEQ